MREPLLQFLFAGLLLFAGYRALNPSPDARDDRHRIELTADDLRQIAVAWSAQGRPLPTAEQMRSLLEARVREEVLYREALALGLDENDTIVRRRLAQKMEFLAEETSDAREPTTEELEVWFGENSGRFVEPGRVTFRHLYFSPDHRGGNARDDAAAALRSLTDLPADAPAADSLGDRFMFQSRQADRSPDEIARDFGNDFALALFGLAPGSWQGPVESGYGWHVVFVESSTPGRVPALEEIAPEVRNAWLAERRAAAWSRVYDEMRAKYEVVLPGLPAAAGIANEPAPSASAPP